MEHQNPRKTVAFLLISFLLLQAPKPSLSQPLLSSPPPQPTSIAPKHHPHLHRVLTGVLLGVLTGAIASLLFLLAVRASVHFAARTPILKGPVVFSPQISSRSLHSALSDPAHAPAGDCFQLSLDNGLVVAVKRLELDRPNASSPKPNLRRAQRELELLARAKHQNVMSLRAYSRDQDRFFLVYDYLPTGSLEDAMKRVRAGQMALGWEARHRIAVGVAKGLRYLHFDCSPRILHYRLNPANVVLDEGFEPRLGHCGLGRLPAAGGSDVLGAQCYAAPECFQSCRYTDKSDIFSFGMILGVLLTGRDLLDPFFSCDSAAGGGGLGGWLRHLQQAGEARDALDSGILGDEVVEEDMLMAVRIALVCLSDLPADRPSSDELVAMLSQLHSF
ncbi:putative inactive leucine-rich repeat receptor-like protein kinase CORYNE [Iris pallida]|uniref:Inactive leucine-rich repeat receptor-like protein kinase CORYNE n=1 Tax=Iris pallida TaxID=29817 RepID=A0AAX6HVP6_IRIPA|nr:putative inactive leucine-rich repeat receptor-like protein kinase CORYNE [Iris pallida]